jgi:hypothetical protein
MSQLRTSSSAATLFEAIGYTKFDNYPQGEWFQRAPGRSATRHGRQPRHSLRVHPQKSAIDAA